MRAIHHHSLTRWATGLPLAALLLVGAPALAQGVSQPRVQEITDTIDDSSDLIFYDLYALPAGHTLYVYMEATTGDLDTYLMLGDIDFEDVYLEDDDGGGGTNAAFQYALAEGGDFTLAATRHDETTSGDFRLLVGLDAPEVLTGQARSTGHELAVYYGALPVGGGQEITDCSVLFDRPALSGAEERLETNYFVLHYTIYGADGATPSFADEVSRILDRIWKRSQEIGWPSPPTDCGEGGDTRYDIYLMDILDEGMLGYSMPEGILGDNPLSSLPEDWAAYSFLVVDNDFSGYRDPFSIMLTTAVHEFSHSIQFGYDINDIGGGWYYEATASWMEAQSFPEHEDATPYVDGLFAYPDRCIGSTPETDTYEERIYGEWLLIDSLAQDYGPQVVVRLWENIAVYEGMESFYRLLQDLGTTPQTVIRRFAIRNLLLDYALADRFPSRVRVEANINGVGLVRPRRDGVEELSVDYLLVTKPDVYTFAIDQPNLTLIAVGVDQQTDAAYVFDLGRRGTVDATPYDYTYVIVLNVDEHTDNEACTMTDWELSVTQGGAEALLEPEPKVWNAVNFIPAG